MITRLFLVSAGIAWMLSGLAAQGGNKKADKGFRDKELVRKDDVKDGRTSHVGTFLKATGDRFVIEAKGREQTHILASDAKILGPDGREFSLADLRKGQMLRVTTRDPDPMTALLVEVLKASVKDKTPDGK